MSLRPRDWRSGLCGWSPGRLCALALWLRCCMLRVFFHTQLQLGFAQAAIAALAALSVVFLARRSDIHLEGEALIAVLRVLVQIIAVGSVLLIVVRASRCARAFLLAVLVVAAG